MEYIFRELKLNKIGKKACANFIQSLALCNCNILSSSIFTNDYDESQVRYYSIIFKLGFDNQDDLDKFHSYGFDTTKLDYKIGFRME